MHPCLVYRLFCKHCVAVQKYSVTEVVSEVNERSLLCLRGVCVCVWRERYCSGRIKAVEERMGWREMERKKRMSL